LKTTFRIALIVLFLITLIACEYNQNSVIVIEEDMGPEAMLSGNSTGNIANDGLAVHDDDRIYFSNGYDSGKIYMVKNGNSKPIRINNYSSRYLNIVGDWIYYSNLDYNARIYRVSIDGGKDEPVNSDRSDYINIIDGWIYYINKDDQGRIYKIDLDGHGRMQVGIDRAHQMAVSGDWIYFVKLDDVNIQRIYKMRTDGSEQLQINDLHSRFINVTDEWIYFSGQPSALSGPSHIYKMRPDGNEITRILDDDASNINVVDEWIYYIKRDEGNKIYKVRIDGSAIEKMNDEQSLRINIAGDWVIYQTRNEESTFRMNACGGEKGIITDKAILLLDDITLAGEEKPYSEIQRAIDNALNGDTIIIEPGVYEGNIDFKGKEIKLVSTDPENPDIVATTVIKGGGSGSVVTFQNGEGKGAVLSGFTITGGNGTEGGVVSERSGGGYQYSTWGGGILVAFESSPTIENNIIIGNQSKTGGGLAIIGESSPKIRDNIITENSAETGGGIAVSWYSSPAIEINNITKNKATGNGGGVSLEVEASPTLTENIISDNEAGSTGGGLFIENLKIIIENNIFDDNGAKYGGAIGITLWSSTTFRGNIIKNNNSTYVGGGVYVAESSCYILKNTFSSNCSSEGGAIYSSNSDITMENNRVEGNISDESGGGIYVAGHDAKIKNNFLTENKSGQDGGAIFIGFDVINAYIDGNDFIKNKAADRGGAVWAFESGEYYLHEPGLSEEYLIKAEIKVSDANYYFNNEPDNTYREARENFNLGY